MSQREPMGKVIRLHPNTVDAINAEMAQYELREIRLLNEIAGLHATIAMMRVNCNAALGDCMHPRSVQAGALRRAIELADAKVPRTESESK